LAQDWILPQQVQRPRKEKTKVVKTEGDTLTQKVMKKRDMNKMKMYNQVVLIISEHSPVWQTNVPFAEAYATFSQKVSGLKAYVDSQFSLVGKHTVHKHACSDALIETALRIQRVMVFYAARSENAVLLERVKRSASEWKRANETKRLLQAERLHSLLEEHLAELPDFGLGQPDVDELSARISDYAEAIGEPRSKIVHRTAFTQHIGMAIKELDELLNLQIDTFVRSLETSAPEFVRLFLSARSVVHYKGKGSAEPDSETGGVDE
jgi:hypothetical protein